MQDVDQRQVSGIRKTRRERFAEELPHMRAWIPQAAPDVRLREELIVSREGVIRHQTNRYSVPAALLGERVTLKVDTITNKADIIHDGQLVRTITLLAERAYGSDIRPEDERELRERWQREQQPNRRRSSKASHEQQLSRIDTLIQTAVAVRHPSCYEQLTEAAV